MTFHFVLETGISAVEYIKLFSSFDDLIGFLIGKLLQHACLHFSWYSKKTISHSLCDIFHKILSWRYIAVAHMTCHSADS